MIFHRGVKKPILPNPTSKNLRNIEDIYLKKGLIVDSRTIATLCRDALLHSVFYRYAYVVNTQDFLLVSVPL